MASSRFARQQTVAFERRCPNCSGALKIIAAILETAVIERILDYLGLPVRAPPRTPAEASMSQAA